MGSLVSEFSATAILNLPRADAPPSSSLATPSSSSVASSPRGLVEDMELRALEGKLHLLTIQRQLSAVRCQRFVEELEAYTSSCSSAAPSPASGSATSSMERCSSGAIPTSYSLSSHGSFPDDAADLDTSDGSVMSAWRRAPRRMPHRNSFGSRSVTGSGSISAAYSSSRSRGQCGGSRRSSFDRSYSSPAASSGCSSSSRLSFDHATVAAPAPADSSPLDAEGSGLPLGRSSYRRRTLDGSSTSRAAVRFPRRSPFVAKNENTDSESDCNFHDP